MGNTESASLPYMNANPDTITMSGNSAGCFMAHQMQIIHSETIKGVALYACWPYATSIDSPHNGLTASEIATNSIGTIDSRASAGSIDDTSNLANNAVYVWSGLLDEVTLPEGQTAIDLVYENYGVTKLHF